MQNCVRLETPLAHARHYQPQLWTEARGVRRAALFSAARDEYAAVCERLGVFDRCDRGLLIVSGRDRKSWLHNLVTNAVKTLEPQCGVYAFAIDLRGRVLFDLNILSVGEQLWLDIDLAALPGALAHLNKFLISEDARIEDASHRFARIGVAGRAADAAASAFGIGALTELQALSSAPLGDSNTMLVRHDFAGCLGFELLMPRDSGAREWDRTVETLRATPIGSDVLDVLRIEAGIPWLGRDIDEKTLPPETGQIERGIHYKKGCYLGQEVIERMRSHGVISKRLVRLEADRVTSALPSPISKDGVEIGRLTSLVEHPLSQRAIGLGYLKSAFLTNSSGMSFGDPAQGIRLVSVV